MAQKQFDISQGKSKLEHVVIASNSDSLGGAVARLIVSDTATKSELDKLIEVLQSAFVKTNFPY